MERLSLIKNTCVLDYKTVGSVEFTGITQIVNRLKTKKEYITKQQYCHPGQSSKIKN
jgi:hypothetical protein